MAAINPIPAASFAPNVKRTNISFLSLLQQGLEVLELLAGKHEIDVQQNLDLAFYLRHPQQITDGHFFAEVGRVLDLGGRQVQDLGYAIDNDSHQDLTVLPLYLRDDNARAFCVLGRGQSELHPQVDYG